MSVEWEDGRRTARCGMHARFANFACVGGLLFLCAAADALEDDAPLFQVSLRPGPGPLVVTAVPSKDRPIPAGARLFVVSAGEACWADPVDSAGPSAPTFALRRAIPLATAKAAVGWLVPPHLVARLRPLWPAGLDFEAEVDSVGPGGRSVWLAAGAHQGVRAGDTWWLRVSGQPAARLEVRHVGPSAAFCSVTPLAREVPLRPGSRAALWPRPADERDGSARTAVAYIERRTGDALVWVAAPPEAGVPPEPHLDFLHEGRYIGHGVVERRDERFWYARFIPLSDATAEQLPTPAPAGSGPRAQRDTPSSPAVGDDVLVRTRREIDERRFVARVFDRSPAGPLIDAGEYDGLRTGDTGLVYRGTEKLGEATLGRVQRTYSVLGPAALRVGAGDTVMFGPAPPPGAQVGAISQVHSFGEVTVRLDIPRPPLMRPLAVRGDEGPVGALLLVQAGAGRAAGFVIWPPSAGIRVGMEVFE
ncbi:MAG: hypothetical protein AB1716_13630 [Planctomycetota bacterium]